MIKLERIRSQSAITSGLRGPGRVEKELKLLTGKRDGNLAFNSGNWKRAKDQLKVESHNKCAYCEADTAVVAHGDVEHFRPKTIYWWLAYCYDNYLYSCQICNQLFKGAHFPIHGTRLTEPVIDPQASDADLQALAGRLAPDPLNDSEGVPMADFLQVITAEQAALLNPYQFDPEPLFGWEPDPVLQEVKLVPHANDPLSARAVTAGEQVLGLNREELRELRYREYQKLEVFKNLLNSGQLNPALEQQIKDILVAMTSGNAPFAGMARYFVNTVWAVDLD